jgi:hypothetical protein
MERHRYEREGSIQRMRYSVWHFEKEMPSPRRIENAPFESSGAKTLRYHFRVELLQMHSPRLLIEVSRYIVRATDSARRHDEIAPSWCQNSGNLLQMRNGIVRMDVLQQLVRDSN